MPAQVLYVGVAQEKQKVFRTSKRRNPVTGHLSVAGPWLGSGESVLLLCVDEESGPVCVKFSSYFPYTGRLIINGNEYATRQAAKASIGFVPPGNAFAAVDDVAAVQAICDGLDAGKISALAARLLRLLPHPFTADGTAAGYGYEKLRERARQRWPQLASVGVRFRGQFAYVTGQLADGQELPLCRLRYTGYASTWGFAIYRASHDDYQDNYLPSGQPTSLPASAIPCTRSRVRRRIRHRMST